MVVLAATMVLGAQAQENRQNQTPVQRHGVPAYRGMIERTQPNGYVVRTYLRGDEHMHWMMTEDGWQIQESKNGWLKYVKANRKGALVISNRKVHNAEDRSGCEKRWLGKHGVKKSVS